MPIKFYSYNYELSSDASDYNYVTYLRNFYCMSHLMSRLLVQKRLHQGQSRLDVERRREEVYRLESGRKSPT